MIHEAWVGIALLSVFLTMGLIEAVRPARRFPIMPYWLGTGLATILVLLAINYLVEVLIPQEWIRRPRADRPRPACPGDAPAPERPPLRFSFGFNRSMHLPGQ